MQLQSEMETKSFIADDMNEAFRCVTRDLGEDAIIFSTREFTEGGIFGLMGKRRVEVIAGRPRQAKKAAKPKEKRSTNAGSSEGSQFLAKLAKSRSQDLRPAFGADPSSRAKGFSKDELESILEDVFGAKKGGLMNRGGTGPSRNFQVSSGPRTSTLSLTKTEDPILPAKKSIATEPVQKNRRAEIDQLQREVGDLRGDIKELHKQIRSFCENQKPSQLRVESTEDKEKTVVPVESKLDGLIARLKEELLENEFDAEFIDTHLGVLKEIYENQEAPELKELKSQLKDKFKSLVGPRLKKGVLEELNEEGVKRPKIMVFVGPTGVGKTTTIAKIASTLALGDNPKKIALITIDTFKIGAIEQVKYYGRGLKSEVEAIRKPEEILPAIQRHQDKDVILIDTMGRSQNANLQITSLKDFLPEELQAETHLCLTATARYRDMIETFRAFNQLSVDCLLFTKLDETCCYGPMLSVLQKCTRKISYVTTGQMVPGDYRIIDGEYLSDLMFPSKKFQ